MDSKDEKFLILEQYRIYSEAKEKFIERQFATNRFYLVLNILILILVYALAVLTPQYVPILILSVIGISTSVLWWLNIDSYQLLIKIKYANVLEYLEDKLPEQPYQKEYKDYVETKKNKNLIVFGDFQKVLAFVVVAVFLITFINNITNMIRYQIML